MYNPGHFLPREINSFGIVQFNRKTFDSHNDSLKRSFQLLDNFQNKPTYCTFSTSANCCSTDGASTEKTLPFERQLTCITSYQIDSFDFYQSIASPVTHENAMSEFVC